MKGKEVSHNFIAHYRESDGQFQSLCEHLEQTAKFSAQNASKIGLELQGEIIGLLHDLGKATKEFDSYIRSATGLIDPDTDDYLSAEDNRGKIDHSSAGAQLIYRYLNGKGEQGKMVAQILALVLASHHSGLIDCVSPDGKNKFAFRINKDEGLTRLTEAKQNLNSCISGNINTLLNNERLTSELIEKIRALNDGQDSKKTIIFKIGLLVRFLFSCLIDADRTDTANFENPYEKKIRSVKDGYPWKVLAERLEKHLEAFKQENEVDIIRRDIADRCLKFADRDKGVFQLTVPTGGGKTLSSLRFAINHANKHGMDRIIYVIPFTSIIDQNADVVRTILEPECERNKIVLEHHSNLTPEKEGVVQKILSQNWDAPIVFTTMVQFLEALFDSGTRSARRMHQLANSIIIFDEVQTLPLRCVHMFNVAIRFLVNSCGSTALLCTATQPLLDEVIPSQFALPIADENKIIKDVSGLFSELKRVEVINETRIGGWLEEDVADLVKREMSLTGSVLVVVNTKNSAKRILKHLDHLYRNSPGIVFHLSTAMCPAHRMEVLKRIRKRLDNDQPVICISTQLIEAGVDIDFGSVIRYLAGLDSIAQAAGRCNRNGRRKEKGRVVIINPQHENIDRLIDIKEGIKQTLRVLDEYSNDPNSFNNDLLGDKAIKRYFQYYFHQRQNVMSYPVSSESIIGREDSLFELLSTNELSIKAYIREEHLNLDFALTQSFSSANDLFQAIDSFTRGVIVPYEQGTEIINQLCSDLTIPETYRELKKAQRFSVNLFAHEFDYLCKEEAIHEIKKGSGIFYLDKRYYGEHYGFSLSIENDMDILTK